MRNDALFFSKACRLDKTSLEISGFIGGLAMALISSSFTDAHILEAISRAGANRAMPPPIFTSIGAAKAGNKAEMVVARASFATELPVNIISFRNFRIKSMDAV
ncbi:hypothetical protein KCP73_16525 [Salmonella enterica subsp. enterica]|nr:hypothetical protein KCP73_16525 [Salmonella enterica subsp. enterica]